MQRIFRLLRKMGPDFDPNWMATSKPPSSLLRGETVEMGETQLAELVSQVAELDLDRELKELDGDEDDEDDEVDNFITQDFDEEEIRTKMIGLFQVSLI